MTKAAVLFKEIFFTFKDMPSSRKYRAGWTYHSMHFYFDNAEAKVSFLFGKLKVAITIGKTFRENKFCLTFNKKEINEQNLTLIAAILTALSYSENDWWNVSEAIKTASLFDKNDECSIPFSYEGYVRYRDACIELDLTYDNYYDKILSEIKYAKHCPEKWINFVNGPAFLFMARVVYCIKFLDRWIWIHLAERSGFSKELEEKITEYIRNEPE